MKVEKNIIVNWEGEVLAYKRGTINLLKLGVITTSVKSCERLSWGGRKNWRWCGVRRGAVGRGWDRMNESPYRLIMLVDDVDVFLSSDYSLFTTNQMCPIKHDHHVGRGQRHARRARREQIFYGCDWITLWTSSHSREIANPRGTRITILDSIDYLDKRVSQSRFWVVMLAKREWTTQHTTGHLSCQWFTFVSFGDLLVFI
jgi:hypothetical protein